MVVSAELNDRIHVYLNFCGVGLEPLLIYTQVRMTKLLVMTTTSTVLNFSGGEFICAENYDKFSQQRM